jgi:hypothetical protein
VKRIANRTLSNKYVKREYEQIKTCLKNGINLMEASKKSTALGRDFYLIKGKENQYVVENKVDGV